MSPCPSEPFRFVSKMGIEYEFVELRKIFRQGDEYFDAVFLEIPGKRGCVNQRHFICKRDWFSLLLMLKELTGSDFGRLQCRLRKYIGDGKS